MKKFFKIGCLGFIALFVLIIIIAVAGGGNDQETSNEPNSKTEESNKKTATSTEKDVLTKEKFDKIKDGMTYEEVVKIVGSEGKVMSESGEKGTDLHTIMYEFETDGAFTSSTMMFQGGKLINKSQAGLGGESDAKITLEKFNKIENGMSTKEVFDIIGGKGEVLSESGEPGTDLHTIMYSYSGESLGANANFTFQGDKLQNKSQFGLE